MNLMEEGEGALDTQGTEKTRKAKRRKKSTTVTESTEPDAERQRKKRSRVGGEGVDEEGEAEESRPKRRKKTSSKNRQPEDLADADDPADEEPNDTLEIEYDEDGNPLPINPESVTMAQLCEDVNIGRPSTRTEESIIKSVEWRKSQRMLRQQARARQKAKFAPPGMYQIDSGDAVDTHTDDRGEDEGESVQAEEGGSNSNPENINPIDENAQTQTNGVENEDDFSRMKRNQFTAQVRLDENGDIILDDLSLTVDRHEAARLVQPVEDWEIIEEAEKDRFINSLSYSKKLTSSRWLKEETELFYHVSLY